MSKGILDFLDRDPEVETKSIQANVPKELAEEAHVSMKQLGFKSWHQFVTAACKEVVAKAKTEKRKNG